MAALTSLLNQGDIKALTAGHQLGTSVASVRSRYGDPNSPVQNALAQREESGSGQENFAKSVAYPWLARHVRTELGERHKVSLLRLDGAKRYPDTRPAGQRLSLCV